MNERIKELIKEHRVNITIDGLGYGEGNIEGLAELIVKECLGCCEQVISDPVPELVDTWLNGGTQCMAEIRKHFGVEE